MIGCHAEAITEDIRMEDELEDAQWFTKEEVRKGLLEGEKPHSTQFRLPAGYTIAHQLVRHWALQ